MDTLAFDGRAGANGDTVVGALLAAGADRAALAPVEDALDVTYRVDRVEECGVAATDVSVDAGGGDGRDGGDDAARTHREAVELVEGMDLPAGVAADASATIELLDEARAAVHGTDRGDARAVGADDAIAVVVGATLLLDDLDPDRVVTTPVSAGGGEVTCSRGTYPVPAPAVTEIAARADWRVRGGPVDRELLTPTGAAILAHHAEGVDALPPVEVTASGYGAGDADLDGRPNVLRALAGDARGRLVEEDIAVLETSLDDASPEILGGLQDSLREVGARDVSVVPLSTKKSRPGHLVKVVARPGDAERVARRLAAETGTLGVRATGATHQWVADREMRTVTLDVDGDEFDVDVKIASDDRGDVFDVSAEYDDAAAVAGETGLPTREVMRRAEDEVR